ncbi:MAG: peptide deformylase, partial [Endomicrobiia bacterium]
MTVLKIVKYPNPILKKKLKLVVDFNSRLKSTIRDMFESMYTYNGIGLAANQVGIDMSIVIVDISKVEKKIIPLALVNPVITKYSDEKELAEEGCLSFPGYYDKVQRSKYLEVSYYDINGKPQKLQAEGLLARVLQHEIDHINGINFVQRMT